MKNREEVEEGNRSIAINWAIVFFVYLLLLIWLEPIIDLMLGLNPPDMEMSAFQVFNEKKAYVTTVVFGIARSLPILLFLWIAYQVVATTRLPPKGLKMPVTVRVITGDQARVIGYAMIVVALILLFREVHLIVNA